MITFSEEDKLLIKQYVEIEKDIELLRKQGRTILDEFQISYLNYIMENYISTEIKDMFSIRGNRIIINYVYESSNKTMEINIPSYDQIYYENTTDEYLSNQIKFLGYRPEFPYTYGTFNISENMYVLLMLEICYNINFAHKEINEWLQENFPKEELFEISHEIEDRKTELDSLYPLIHDPFRDSFKKNIMKEFRNQKIVRVYNGKLLDDVLKFMDLRDITSTMAEINKNKCVSKWIMQEIIRRVDIINKKDLEC